MFGILLQFKGLSKATYGQGGQGAIALSFRAPASRRDPSPCVDEPFLGDWV